MKETISISKLYHQMLLIRRVEETIMALYPTDKIKSPIHLSIGQESIAVGVCAALEKEDLVSNTYRCHATYLAKGGDLNTMMAELYGKKTGCAGGKAGSMHLIDMSHGILGASAVVGTTLPVAMGFAWALKQEAKKTGQQHIVAAFFGDGATEEGSFSESLNFIALHKLPMLLICENNRLAIHSPLEKRWATEQLRERVATYGIETHHIQNGDVQALYELSTHSVQRLRTNGTAPIFIECETYRWLEHVGPTDDHHAPYRDTKILNAWKERDSIAKLSTQLSDTEKNNIHREIEHAIEQAIAFAEQSPFPGQEDLMRHSYAA